MGKIEELNTDVGTPPSPYKPKFKDLRKEIRAKGQAVKNKAEDLRNREAIKNDNKKALKKSFLAKAKGLLSRR
jgi:hypothetical protein